MSIFTRFRAMEEDDKAAVVRKLVQASTPNFDFFYITALSVFMATLGLLLDNTSVVIGSMLIAPLLYPILAVALGLAMSSQKVIGRSLFTLGKAMGIALSVAIIATIFLGSDPTQSAEIMSRTEPSILYFIVALVAGAAVAFAIGQPEWSESLPGISISVALIPPLAVMGIGIANLNVAITTGATVLFVMNVIGIIFASMTTFLLMNLVEKRDIARSTMRREAEKLEQEAAMIEALESDLKDRRNRVTKKGIDIDAQHE